MNKPTLTKDQRKELIREIALRHADEDRLLRNSKVGNGTELEEEYAHIVSDAFSLLSKASVKYPA
jgi:hypothetical protein